jgi:hypothetical protein
MQVELFDEFPRHQILAPGAMLLAQFARAPNDPDTGSVAAMPFLSRLAPPLRRPLTTSRRMHA